MSNQTDGRRSAKNTATSREHLRPPPVTATGLLCRPQNTPHDPCKSLRSRGNSQLEPKTSPGSAFATLGGNDVQRQKQTSTPRTCISAFDNGHSLSTRPSLSSRYLKATQCNPLPRLHLPPSPAISHPPPGHRPSTGQVPRDCSRRRSQPSTSSTPPPCLDSSLASPTLESHTTDNGQEEGQTAMLVNTV